MTFSRNEMTVADRGQRTSPRRCGRITNPGEPYPLPCVKEQGHPGDCDPRPKLLVGKHPKPVDGNVGALHD